jgi:hypothetical protein
MPQVANIEVSIISGILFNYDKNYISKRTTELGFIRDTLKKVYCLADIFNTNPTLKESLALK